MSAPCTQPVRQIVDWCGAAVTPQLALRHRKSEQLRSVDEREPLDKAWNESGMSRVLHELSELPGLQICGPAKCNMAFGGYEGGRQ